MIRKAGPDDAASIATVHVSSWEGVYRGLMPDSLLDSVTVERRTQGWRRILTSDRAGVTLVAEVDGRIVGFSDVGPSRDEESRDAAEVVAIYVHPDFWDQGYGRELMIAALDWARADGYKRAILWVLDTNERGRSFYERGGWVADGAVKIDESFGEPLREVRYVIEL